MPMRAFARDVYCVPLSPAVTNGSKPQKKNNHSSIVFESQNTSPFRFVSLYLALFLFFQERGMLGMDTKERDQRRFYDFIK
jgi:hypothetical protein